MDCSKISFHVPLVFLNIHGYDNYIKKRAPLPYYSPPSISILTREDYKMSHTFESSIPIDLYPFKNAKMYNHGPIVKSQRKFLNFGTLFKTKRPNEDNAILEKIKFRKTDENPFKKKTINEVTTGSGIGKQIGLRGLNLFKNNLEEPKEPVSMVNNLYFNKQAMPISEPQPQPMNQFTLQNDIDLETQPQNMAEVAMDFETIEANPSIVQQDPSIVQQDPSIVPPPIINNGQAIVLSDELNRTLQYNIDNYNITDSDLFIKQQAQYFFKIPDLKNTQNIKSSISKFAKELQKISINGRYNGAIEMNPPLLPKDFSNAQLVPYRYPYSYKTSDQLDIRDKILLQSPIVLGSAILVDKVDNYIDIKMPKVNYGPLNLLPKKLTIPILVDNYVKQPLYINNYQEKFPDKYQLGDIDINDREMVPWIFKSVISKGDYITRNILNPYIDSDKFWRGNQEINTNHYFAHLVPNLARDRVTYSKYNGLNLNFHDTLKLTQSGNYNIVTTQYKNKLNQIRFPNALSKYIIEDYTKDMIESTIQEANDNNDIEQLYQNQFWQLVFLYKMLLDKDVSPLVNAINSTLPSKCWRLGFYITPKEVFIDLFRRMDDSFWGWPQLFPLIFNTPENDVEVPYFPITKSIKRQLAEVFAKVYIFQGLIVNRRQWRIFEAAHHAGDVGAFMNFYKDDNLKELLKDMFKYGNDRAISKNYFGNVYVLHPNEILSRFGLNFAHPPVEFAGIEEAGKSLTIPSAFLKNKFRIPFHFCWLIYPSQNSAPNNNIILTAAVPPSIFYMNKESFPPSSFADPCLAFPINEIDMDATLFDYSLNYEVNTELELPNSTFTFPNSKNFLLERHRQIYGH